MNFGERVRQLRAERNLTQPQLAQAIGIEQSYLSKLENDRSVPSAEIFQAILKAFDMDAAGLLHGVDEKQVRRDLRQVPEVANHLDAQVAVRVHRIKSWLYGSAIALALGLTLVVAGYRALAFPNIQYNYESLGVTLPGEPSDLLDSYRDRLSAQHRAGKITEQERLEKVAEIEARRSLDYQVHDEYRGRAYTVDVVGGQRTYYFQHPSQFERPQNRWLMLVGTLLAMAGLTGFFTESRLRQVRP